VACGPQGARPWGSPNLKGVRRSHPSHLVDRHDHTLHFRTLCIWIHRHVGGGWEETCSPLEEACGERPLRRSSSQLIGFWHKHLLYVGAPRMGAILQWGVDKYPQEICLGNSNDHGAHPWWGGAESLIPVGGNLASGSLWTY
jgi:hypothetical protein